MDLRKKKTIKAIVEAFIELVNANGYNKLTINQLAQKAMINRNTFYNYFEDKEDLVEKLSQKFIADSKGVLAKALTRQSDEHIHYFFKHRSLIRALFESKFYSQHQDFESQLIQAFKEVLYQEYQWSSDSLQSLLVSMNTVSIIKYIVSTETEITSGQINQARQAMFSIINQNSDA